MGKTSRSLSNTQIARPAPMALVLLPLTLSKLLAGQLEVIVRTTIAEMSGVPTIGL